MMTEPIKDFFPLQCTYIFFCKPGASCVRLQFSATLVELSTIQT